MDYYEKRAKATRFINEQVKKGVQKPIILSNLQQEFGFSAKFLEETLQIIEDKKKALQNLKEDRK